MALLIDFAHLPDDVFVPICVQLVQKANRWVVMTCEWRHDVKLEDSGVLVRLGVWLKPNPTPQFTGDRPGTGWEAVAICHRKGRKRWNGGGHSSAWIYNKVCGDHPTQKPLILIEKWVGLFSDCGETILDPFLGSGTTAIACIRTGRQCIGIELEEKYCEIAARRCDRELDQKRLPFDEPKQETQTQRELFE